MACYFFIFSACHVDDRNFYAINESNIKNTFITHPIDIVVEFILNYSLEKGKLIANINLTTEESIFASNEAPGINGNFSELDRV